MMPGGVEGFGERADIRRMFSDPSPLHYCLIATAYGPVGLAWTERGLRRLQLPYVDRDTTADLLGGRDAVEADPPDWLARTIRELQRYFSGTELKFSEVPLDLEAEPEFHRDIYLEMLKLGWGETVTYGELAARVGAPGEAQAVGRAMGQNPIAVVIPCHRVLAAGNKIGGYSAPGGKATKRKLLDMEGVVLGDRTQLAFGF
jgi:methylated-DNA-[protein]-cysteine S-methyltransferase